MVVRPHCTFTHSTFTQAQEKELLEAYSPTLPQFLHSDAAEPVQLLLHPTGGWTFGCRAFVPLPLGKDQQPLGGNSLCTSAGTSLGKELLFRIQSLRAQSEPLTASSTSIPPTMVLYKARAMWVENSYCGIAGLSPPGGSDAMSAKGKVTSHQCPGDSGQSRGGTGSELCCRFRPPCQAM